MKTKAAIMALKQARRPSEITGEQYCNRCGLCCELSPCQFESPADVRRLSDHVGLPLPYFVSRYVARWPAEGGRVVTPMHKPDGSCIFLHDKQCEVHEAVPKGGRLFECWTETGRNLKPLVW